MTAIPLVSGMRKGFYSQRRILRLAVAVIILTAALLKAWQLASVPSLGGGLLHARWFNILVVEFELLFGTWLIFGLLPEWTWLATIACFMVFTSVSLFKALSGEASCGCFGAVTIHPWITATADIGVIGLLMFFHPKDIWVYRNNLLLDFYAVFRKRIFAMMVLVWFFLTIPVTYMMLSAKTLDASELGEVFSGVYGSNTITLKPEQWLHQDFSLSQYTNIKNHLDQGIWLVLLHTHTCSSCQESVRLYRELAVEFAPHKTAPKIAMIELPPYESQQTAENPDDPVLYGKLDKSRQWKIRSPALLLIDNHNVQNVFDNPLETDLIRSIWGNKK